MHAAFAHLLGLARKNFQSESEGEKRFRFVRKTSDSEFAEKIKDKPTHKNGKKIKYVRRKKKTSAESTSVEVKTSDSSNNAPITISVPTDRPADDNSSSIIIPIPDSQRKAYHPVIMHSSTAAPGQSSKLTTYKLNKLFVPMGIYGKVLPEGANATGPEIRHKGSLSNEETSSMKQARKGDPEQKWENLMEKIKEKSDKTRKSKSHSPVADTIHLTYDYKQQPEDISLTTQRIDPGKIDLTTEMPSIMAAFKAGQKFREKVDNGQVS